jgi:vancomycin resistance protein YoaR
VAEEAVLDDDELSLAAPVEPIEPKMTATEVRRAKREAQAVIASPVTLRAAGGSVELQPRQLAAVMKANVVEEGAVARIELSVNANRLRALEPLDRLSSPPQDADFRLTNGRVRVVVGKPGISVDARALADELLAIARSEDRAATAPVRKVAPEFSTGDARKLNIDEQVSTFTTYHSCCEPRVDNIHRIADLIDGSVVRPGDEFSINDTVGQRTTGNGFVPAPAISNGEYVEEVGGGISQFATTIFNATFFGGYDFLEYKTHSYYISRYPMGREATVSWPAPDFRFLNDSGSGVYIDTSYSDTSITVTFYGSKERSVRSVSGDPHDYKPPPTQCKVNKSLRRGERRVVQTGSRGFDITVTRVFGSGEREDFNTTYLPVPEIVERRRCD